METVIDLFRKLGLRQAFVTHNGYIFIFWQWNKFLLVFLI